jgi:hypothetical protein
LAVCIFVGLVTEEYIDIKEETRFSCSECNRVIVATGTDDVSNVRCYCKKWQQRALMTSAMPDATVPRSANVRDTRDY